MKIMIKIAQCYTSPISSNDWESGTFSELAVKEPSVDVQQQKNTYFYGQFFTPKM